MIETLNLDQGFTSAAIWQTCGDDEGVPEPALLVRNYYGRVIGIQQGKQEVLLNADTVRELTTFLRNLASLGDPVEQKSANSTQP